MPIRVDAPAPVIWDQPVLLPATIYGEDAGETIYVPSVMTGFVWSLACPGRPVVFYLDDIRWEQDLPSERPLAPARYRPGSLPFSRCTVFSRIDTIRGTPLTISMLISKADSPRTQAFRGVLAT